MSLRRFETLDLLAFDLDGVLADTSPSHSHAWQALWNHLGIEGPPYAAILGRSTEEVVAEVTRPMGPSAEQLAAWVEYKQCETRRQLEAGVPAFADTLPAIAALANCGLSLALATSASRPRAKEVLTRLELDGTFAPIVAAEDVKHGKPDPEPYRSLIGLTGIDADRVLVVEDSDVGVRSGLSAGARVVSVRTGVHNLHPCFEAALADLAELVDFLGVALPGGRAGTG